jgi:hypothetical protein
MFTSGATCLFLPGYLHRLILSASPMSSLSPTPMFISHQIPTGLASLQPAPPASSDFLLAPARLPVDELARGGDLQGGELAGGGDLQGGGPRR